MNAAKIQSIVSNLEELDASPSDLDEFVHDCANSVASDVNNAGIEAQVEFLLGNGVNEKDIISLF